MVAAVLAAAAPMLTPGLPVGADTVTHLYTLVHVEDLLRHGVLFSRWLAWQNGGLGNPRFLFYPWMPYYAAEPIVLLGLSHVLALRAAFVAALALAALGAFAWCRQWCDEPAAAVGAVAYVLSPYLLFAVYARASFAEVVALGVAPWALWGAVRWAADPSAGRLAASAALAALTILCHPITGGLLLPAWAALHLVGARLSGRRVAGSLAALALALGASAVLWLPARAERGEISDVHTQSAGLDYRHNFLHPGQLVAWSAPARLQPGLGVAGLLLAGVGIVAGRRQPDDSRRRGILATLLVALSLLAVPSARLLWSIADTLARDVQFPHRLLGPASLLLAGLAADGAAVVLPAAGLPRQSRRLAPPIALGLLLLASVVPLRHRGRLGRVPPLDVETIAAKDRLSGFRGYGYAGEFMPVTVPRLSGAWRAAPDPRERLSVASLPPGARLLTARYDPLRYRVRVESASPWRSVWKTLAFPGWSAAVDGHPVPTANTPEGLLAVDVPAGGREVAISFGSTAARRRGGLLSGATALVLVGMAAAGRLAGGKRSGRL